jgi:acetate kinase
VAGYTDAAMLTLSRIREMLAESAWNSPESAAHRVKFAGIGPHVQDFDEGVCNQLRTNAYLSSRHNALCLAARDAAIACFPKARQIAVRDSIGEEFDLHRDFEIPFPAAIAGRYELAATGHHGLAVGSVIRLIEASAYVHALEAALIIHIGSGVSVTAVREKKPVFNTMQFAACDGPVMHNRCGSIPPGMILRLLKNGVRPSELSELLNMQSGIYGLANVSPAGGVSVEAILENPVMAEARDAYLDALAVETFRASLRVPDLKLIAFSGGISARHPWIATALIERLPFLHRPGDRWLRDLPKQAVVELSDANPRVVLVTIDEQAEILRESLRAESVATRDVERITGGCIAPGLARGVLREVRAGEAPSDPRAIGVIDAGEFRLQHAGELSGFAALIVVTDTRRPILECCVRSMGIPSVQLASDHRASLKIGEWATIVAADEIDGSQETSGSVIARELQLKHPFDDAIAVALERSCSTTSAFERPRSDSALSSAVSQAIDRLSGEIHNSTCRPISWLEGQARLSSLAEFLGEAVAYIDEAKGRMRRLMLSVAPPADVAAHMAAMLPGDSADLDMSLWRLTDPTQIEQFDLLRLQEFACSRSKISCRSTDDWLMNELDRRGYDVFEFVKMRFALEATSTEFVQAVTELVVLRALVLRHAGEMLGTELADILETSHRTLVSRIRSLEYECFTSRTSSRSV